MIGLNKEPRLRFTDEERADPALEKPIRKTEKATARADKAQANIPKKKVRQTVIDPDTGKKTSKLTFEDKKKPPSKLSQGVKEAPVHLVAGKFHKEIRETEQDNVGVESAHKSEEAVETSAYLVREGYRSPVSYTHLTPAMNVSGRPILLFIFWKTGSTQAVL